MEVCYRIVSYVLVFRFSHMTRSFSSADASADFLVVVVLSLVVVLLCFSCVSGGCGVRFGARSVRVLNGPRRASTPLYRVVGLPCRRVQQGYVCSKTAVLDVFQPSIDRSSIGAVRPFPPSFLPSLCVKPGMGLRLVPEGICSAHAAGLVFG